MVCTGDGNRDFGISGFRLVLRNKEGLKMTTKTYEPKCGLHKGADIQFSQQNTCEVCGYQGIDVHEYPTYSQVLNRDTTEYQCDDINACLNRKYAGTYMERVSA